MRLSSLFDRVEKFGDHIKGGKSRLGVGLSSRHRPDQFKKITGDILVLQNEDLERVAGKDYRLVIGLNEL